MADMEDQRSDSPPLARGAYTLDWDNLDPYADPFATTSTKSKSAMMNSPVSAPAHPPSFSPQVNNTTVGGGDMATDSPQITPSKKKQSPRNSPKPKKQGAKSENKENTTPIKSPSAGVTSPPGLISFNTSANEVRGSGEPTLAAALPQDQIDLIDACTQGSMMSPKGSVRSSDAGLDSSAEVVFNPLKSDPFTTPCPGNAPSLTAAVSATPAGVPTISFSPDPVDAAPLIASDTTSVSNTPTKAATLIKSPPVKPVTPAVPSPSVTPTKQTTATILAKESPSPASIPAVSPPLPTIQKSADPVLSPPLPAASQNEAMDLEEAPLPRGAYSIDWDNLDEFSDPFGGSGGGMSAAKEPAVAAAKASPKKKKKTPVKAAPEPVRHETVPNLSNGDVTEEAEATPKCSEPTNSKTSAAAGSGSDGVKKSTEDTDGGGQPKRKKPVSKFRKFKKNFAKQNDDGDIEIKLPGSKPSSNIDSEMPLMATGDGSLPLPVLTASSSFPAQTGPSKEDQGGDSGKGSLVDTSGEGDMKPPPTSVSTDTDEVSKGTISPDTGAEEFMDAKDDVEDEQFMPANEYMFDQAALDVLAEKGTGTGDEFAQSARGRQSLYRKFDPLMKDGQPAGAHNTTASANLMMMDTPPPSNTASLVTGASTAVKHPAHRRLEEVITGVAVGGGNHEGSQNGSEVGSQPSYAPSPRREVDILLGATPTGLLQSHSDSIGTDGRLGGGMTSYSSTGLELQNKVLMQDKALAEKQAQYERVAQLCVQLSQLCETGSEQDRKELSELSKENEILVNRLTENENSRSFLHSSYEKARRGVEETRSKQKELADMIHMEREAHTETNRQFRLFQQEAQRKLEECDDAIETALVLEAQKDQLIASRKRLELQVSSLERSLSQKTQENKELSDICDELISKVS